MDFIIDLLISTDWKGDSYNSILVIINRLTKVIHYKPVQVMIDIANLVKVIIKVMV